MKEHSEQHRLEIFATCPQSTDWDGGDYLKRVADVARWSERHGCTGILVYTDNRLVDPWLVAQCIVQSTERLCPLVAVQPVYMHPYSVAKLCASIGHLYRRRVFLNMVAGGFRNDLLALDDGTPHDQRYARLIEYTRVVVELCRARQPLTFTGEFYRTNSLKLQLPLAEELAPGVFVSGSSDAGLAAARALGATAIMYPKPSGEDPGASQLGCSAAGVRVGIIARPSDAEAWRVARARFPEDRKGQITHQLAMKSSDSVWHRELSTLGERRIENSPYYLEPFRNYRTFCPYLVGSYETAAREVARYIALGYRTFILDIPPDEAELRHAGLVFRAARGVSA